MKTLNQSSYQLDDINYKVELVDDQNDRSCYKILINDVVVYKFTSLDHAKKCFNLVITHAGDYTKIFDEL